MWNNISKLSRNLFITTIISAVLWVLYILTQQWNYQKPEQVYLIGTNLSYGLSFVFFFVLILFVLSFIHNRFHAKKLRLRFILFSIFYLIMGPLTVLGFDNYLLLTQNGIQYNTFFNIEDAKVREWHEINQLELDYIINEPKKTYTQDDLRLLFILHFDDGTSIDLNNYNSPLYRKDQFLKLIAVLKKNDIPIKIKKPLPKEFKDSKSYLYQLFTQKPTSP
ncbi:hypothetical protein MK805_00545 [Shimazuella sp. AN120528]|uniref:hypothetical protein n=1 Tax=Shimazuella soli TaxID=1892854 RepID=UPI001F0D161C|nr:hypothetical protein [Shimazuella soli]MCH5583461.1 hypothetical protein [Shimazuella soli]